MCHDACAARSSHSEAQYRVGPPDLTQSSKPGGLTNTPGERDVEGDGVRFLLFAFLACID
jgi:hypothetical protein